MNSSSNVRFELLEADDYQKYRVDDAREIRFILRQLAAKHALVSIYPDRSNQFGLSSLIEVPESGNKLVLDAVADPAIEAELVVSSRISCITQLDKVKIQFDLGGLRKLDFRGAPALEAKMPDSVLRLQRREYFRLVAPVSHSVRCSLPIPLPDGGTRWYEARVIDISGGGLSIVAPPSGMVFQPEMEFRGCRLELPDSAPVSATLKVRNLFRVTQRNGTEVMRAGCQFVGLSPAMETAIHRYILRIERERAARGAD